MQSIQIELLDPKALGLLEELVKLELIRFEKNESETSVFEIGSYQDGEKPSDFIPIWTGEKRDLKEIRTKAWRRTK